MQHIGKQMYALTQIAFHVQIKTSQHTTGGWVHVNMTTRKQGNFNIVSMDVTYFIVRTLYVAKCLNVLRLTVFHLDLFAMVYWIVRCQQMNSAAHNIYAHLIFDAERKRLVCMQ